jgi:hypothetical protein
MLILLSQIKADGGTQPRAQLKETLAAEYAEAMRDGAKFPPVVLFHDGTDHWLADGFHRHKAALDNGLVEIDADVRQGSRRDAVLFSVGANATHGQRRTNDDKRRAILTLLNDEEWHTWSDSEIARRCGVSDKTVARHRPESIFGNSEDAPAARTVARGGKTFEQDTSNIGKRPAGTTISSSPPKPQTTVSQEDAEPSTSDDPAPAVDQLGQAVTGQIAEAFRRRDEIGRMMQAISQIKATVTEARKQGDPLYAALNENGLLADLRNARERLKAIRPYAICPYCAGEGCKACLGRGWVGEFAYKQAPNDLKEGEK